MRFALRLASLGLAALVLSGSPVALAQGKAKPAPKVVKGKKAPAKAPAKAEPESEAPAETKPDAPSGAPEGAVKAAGTKAKEPEKTGDQARVTEVEESQKDK